MEIRPETNYLPYWQKIKSSAQSTKDKKLVTSAGAAFALAGGGAALGTLACPLVGTIIGGMSGLAASLYSMDSELDLQKQRVYSQVLMMDDAGGVNYAKTLFASEGAFLSEDVLANDIMPKLWIEHSELLHVSPKRNPVMR
jgi:hypothetical protein